MRIRPARIDFTAWPPRSLDCGDVYHPAAGARAQARHVFLDGNDLPTRWQNRSHFAILETGFGFGHNFLSTWRAWRQDPRRSARLDFVSLESRPPSRDDLARAHAGFPGREAPPDAADIGSGAYSTAAVDGVRPEPDPLSQALIAQWPPLVAGLHLRRFDEGRVRLLVGFGEAQHLLPRLIGRFDAFFLDGFAPAVNPSLWEAPLMKSLGRLAAPGATAATWSVARRVRDGLSAAGFSTTQSPGFGAKREMTRARFAPRATASRPPGRPGGPWPGERRAVIIGAGLAGAGVAQALARQGWRCTVLDAQPTAAAGASGNPGGLFHPVIHRADGPYARLHRAAALLAHGLYAPLVDGGLVPGSVDGLLLRRVTPDDARPGRDLEGADQAHGRVTACDDPLPADRTGWARVVSADEARSFCGAWRNEPALLLPPAGWVDPSALVRHWLSLPGIEFRGQVHVEAIEPASAEGRPGTVRDAHGSVIAEAPLIVLANGTGVRRWLADGLIDMPALSVTRGQLTWFPHNGLLRRPVSGDGYALPLPDGRLLCGASSQPDDAASDAALKLRDDDHRWNLERLQRLTGLGPPTTPRTDGAAFGLRELHDARANSPVLGGRAQWRVNTADRLPLIGPVPAAASVGRRDQARFVQRIPGLYIAAAFGSRGLCWAPLAGELIASWVEGTPLPLEADLVDAVDPARWPVRRHRKNQGDVLRT